MNRNVYAENRVVVGQEEKVARPTALETQATNDKLVKAVRIALQSVSAQRASPAWAVLNIFYETALHEDDDEQWAIRLLRMTPDDYSIKWDISLDGWSSNGTIDFSGLEIAQQCAYSGERDRSFRSIVTAAHEMVLRG
jgi:hypothetical protein